MGHLVSQEATQGHHQQLNVKELKDLFAIRAMSVFSGSEIASIIKRANVKSIDEGSTLSISDLANILQLSKQETPLNDEKSNLDSNQESSEDLTGRLNDGECIRPLLEILHRSFTILGRLPFVADESHGEGALTLKSFVVGVAVHTGRMCKIWPDFDYLKLLFISLALSNPDSQRNTENKDSDLTTSGTEKGDSSESPNDSRDSMRKITVEMPLIPDEGVDSKVHASLIKWEKLDALVSYGGLDFDSLTISAYDLCQVLTLLLIMNSIPDQAHDTMQEMILNSAFRKWQSFETAAISLLRFSDVTINLSNIKTQRISYNVYRSGNEGALDGFWVKNFSRLFKSTLLSPIVPLSEPGTRKVASKFTPSRLIDEATLSVLALSMRNINADVEITPQNVVELYNGAHSGFSIRSLESKIFKWQAPTIFFVSGKRLRRNTITKNKRYQKFDTEYPRFFRSTEDYKRNWQTDQDRITYAVFVKQPWRNSNKKNFGDEESAILAISPRYDFFKSKRGLLTEGKSIYFNSQGMGLGFGNEQPINNNTTHKYLPGSVSLTIEANLEFGVFRHLVNTGANTPSFFERSSQDSVTYEDIEDRFVITDLEVWGVGSTKELDEQRKQWEWEEKQAQARQGVNVRNLGEERAFLEMVGLVGNQGSGGSM